MKYFNIYIINNNFNIYSNKTTTHTLLEILEFHNIVIEYQCRQGYCGFCKIHLNKGDIYYQKRCKPIAFLKLGEICSCCCYVKNNIEIIL